MSDFPVVSPVAAAVASAVGSAVTGSDSGRWYLHWGGVNQYAQHSAWNMSGFGDVVSETITPAAPGTGDQYLWANSDASWGLYIDDSTGDLILDYVDVDGSTARTITGPSLSAGETVSYSIEFAADGVTMTVGATDYTNANTPELGSIVYLSANNTPASYFQGTRENLRYTNATALQGVNAVMGNGVDLYGTIPEITLTGDCEIEFDFISGVISAAYDVLGGGSTFIRCQQSGGTTGNFFVVTSSGTASFPNKYETSNGQHHKFIWRRVSGASTLEVDGVIYSESVSGVGNIVVNKVFRNTAAYLASNSTIQNLKITDKSGAEDVVYQYDLSGDDGSDIPITIDGVASTPGTWQNYDAGTDQVALPVLSRNYRMKDGPDALFLEDANHPLGPEQVDGWGTSVDASITINGDVAEFLNTPSAKSQPTGYADSGAQIGKSHQFTFEVFDYVSGEVRPRLGFNGAGEYVSADGTYSQLITGDVVDGTAIRFFTNSVCTFKIRNVSVKCIETGAVLYNTAPEDWSRSKT